MADSKLTIKILIVIILLLLLLVAYAFAVKPAIGSYVVKKQNEAASQGYQYGYGQVILQIMNQASQCEQVPLIYGNQTMNIVWVDCLQN